MAWHVGWVMWRHSSLCEGRTWVGLLPGRAFTHRSIQIHPDPSSPSTVSGAWKFRVVQRVAWRKRMAEAHGGSAWWKRMVEAALQLVASLQLAACSCRSSADAPMVCARRLRRITPCLARRSTVELKLSVSCVRRGPVRGLRPRTLCGVCSRHRYHLTCRTHGVSRTVRESVASCNRQIAHVRRATCTVFRSRVCLRGDSQIWSYC